MNTNEAVLERHASGTMVRDSWRPYAMYGTQARIARLVRRLALTAMTLLLLLWLLYLLLRPFVHPNTYLLYLPAVDTNPLVIDPQAFALEDYVHLSPLESAVKQPPNSELAIPIVPLTTPEELALRLKELDEWRIGSGEAVILYVKTHGMVLDGVPYLLCDNFYPRLEIEGVFPVANLLQQVQRLPGGTKLIVLDTGQSPYDRRLSALDNDFPRAVEQAVQKINDPNLWVLLSHSNLQTAETSPALQRSVFGFMFARGLKGAADLNGDRQIALDELATYLRCSVDQWARQYSDGQAGQVPLLLRGSETPAAPQTFPVLLSTASVPSQTQEVDVSAAMSTAQSPAAQSEISRAVSSYMSFYAEERKQEVVERFRPKLRTQDRLGLVTGPLGSRIASSLPTESAEAPPAGEPESNAEPENDAVSGSVPLEADAELDADSVEINLQYQAVAAPLLTEVWTLRDQLLVPTGRGPRIIDYAPDLWREFEWELLQAEQEHLSGVAANQIALAEKLSDLATSLKALLAQEPPRRRRVPNVIDRAILRKPVYQARGEAIYSLGLAEMLSNFGYTLAKDEQEALDSFRTALAANDRQAFDEWLARPLPTSLRSFNELRFARQLGEQYALSWPLIQLALNTRLQAEQLAADRWADSPWFRRELAETDAQRLGSERSLLAQLGTDWQSQAERGLRQAQARYRTVSSSLADLHDAVELRNDLLRAAPYYVTWHAVALEGRFSPAAAELNALLTSLHELSVLLEQRQESALPQIMKLASSLRQLRLRVEQDLREGEELVREIASNPVPGDARRLQAVLATPLAPAGLRQIVIENRIAVEGQLMSTFEVSLALHMLGTSQRIEDHQLARFLRQARLELLLAKLTLTDSEAKAALLTSLAGELDQLQQQLQQPGGWNQEQLWPTLRTTAEQVAAIYGDLPNRIKRQMQANTDLSAWNTRPARVAQLRGTERCWRMLDPRDVSRMDFSSFAQQLVDLTWFDHLAWQHARYDRQLADAAASDRTHLALALESYRRIASEILRQPPLPESRPLSVEINGPDFVSLSTDTEAVASVEVHQRAAASNQVWLLLEYDPEIIEVKGPPNLVLYRVGELQSQLKSRFAELAAKVRMSVLEASGAGIADAEMAKVTRAEQAAHYPVRPDLAGYAPSLVMAAGESSTLPLKIKRIAHAENDTTLIVKAIHAETYLRHEITVRLPGRETLELLAAPARIDWAATADGLVLHPLPNRSSAFALYLKNNGDRERVVDLKWLIPEQPLPAAMPLGEQTAEVAEDLMTRFGPTRLWKHVPGIHLPTGGQPVPLATSAPAAAEGSENAAATPPPPSPQTEAELEQVVLDHGLLAVITDAQTGRVMFRHVEFAPQRPRRFVDCVVGYNSTTQQIEISVKPLNRALVPPGGHRVECSFAEPLPPGSEARLSGVIDAPNYEARLFAEVPPAYRREMTAYLRIDGYPRAFIYRVPVGPQATNVLEQTDMFRVEIVGPEANAAFQSPLATVPVEVHVDAPRGTFAPEAWDDFVEIGIDIDRDREFRDERAYRFQSDRLVVIAATEFTAGGVLKFDTRVSDFAIDLPTDGLTNAAANLLARVSVGPHVAWSESVPLVLDAAPPRVDRVELDPGRQVEVGQEVEVSVWTSDAGLSGTRRVEIGLSNQSGTFAENPAQVDAQLVGGVRWSGKLKLDKLEPGFHTVLVRMTDAVGNISRMHKESLQIVPAGSRPESQPQPSGATITGVVKYGDALFPGAVVELVPAAEQPEEIVPVTADSAGKFSFRNVAAGEYTLTAQGINRNKLRKAEVPITIEAGDNGLHLFTLQPR